MEEENQLTIKDKIEFLFKEKETAREEVLSNIKAVNQVSLILLPFFFAGVGLLLGNGDVKVTKINDVQLSLLLVIISQIMFLLWMYALSIVANMASLAGYIRFLEERINSLAKEKIAFWESVIQTKYILDFKSVQVICTFFWNLFYFALFIWMTVFMYNNYMKDKAVFFFLNCAEIVIILIVYSLMLRVRNKSYGLSKNTNHA